MTRTDRKANRQSGKPKVLSDPRGWKADFDKSLGLQSCWKRLIRQGCQARPLLALLVPCVCASWESGHRKKDLDEVKRRCDGLIKKLDSVATESEALGKMRLTHMGGISLAASLSLPVNLGMGFGIDPPSNFFRIWPASLRILAARLRELKETMAKAWSIRQHSDAEYVLMLYLYCREATAGKATYANIADLLNAGWEASGIEPAITEDIVRMQVRRLKRPKTAAIFQKIEMLMKQYVASCPTGDLNFMEWALTPNLAHSEAASPAIVANPYEVVAAISKRRARLLEPAPTPPDSPEELKAQIAELLSVFRQLG